MPYQDSPEGQDRSSASSGAPNPPKARTYAETVNHHYLLFQDTDLVNWGQEHGCGIRKSRKLLSFIVGNPKEFQHKDAKLRSCSTFFLLLHSPPQGSFHDLLHREPMLRMQEGEGQSQLCLDRLQLEAIHKVRILALIFSQLWVCGQWRGRWKTADG